MNHVPAGQVPPRASSVVAVSEMEALILSPATCAVRSVIKFLNTQRIAPIEIHRQLCQDRHGQLNLDFRKTAPWKPRSSQCIGCIVGLLSGRNSNRFCRYVLTASVRRKKRFSEAVLQVNSASRKRASCSKIKLIYSVNGESVRRKAIFGSRAASKFSFGERERPAHRRSN
ncbi:hypothetical protein TNCV_4666341 [Trichonephila clavipes]|nr:hypothetical protein TNCV_4666341 [Trichonephila clavipes]